MAGKDIKKRLLPGQSQPVQVGGDFIYMKAADRPITVIINGGESSGSRVVMEAGDKYRPGAFSSFEMENTDPENPAQIIATVGRGDYNRQIIQGEITTVTGVRKADGTFKPDTRQTISAQITPVYGFSGQVVEYGDILGRLGIPADYKGVESLWFDGQHIKVFTQMNYGKPDQAAVWRFGAGMDSAALDAKPRGTTPLTTRLKPVSWAPDGYAFKDVFSTISDKNKIFFYNPVTQVKEQKLALPDEVLDHEQVGTQYFVLWGYNTRKIREYKLVGATLQFVKDWDVSGIESNLDSAVTTFAFNPETKQWTFRAGYNENNRWIAQTNENFEFISSFKLALTHEGAGAGGYYGAIAVGEVFYVIQAETTLFKYAAKDTELTLKGFASSVGCNVDLIADDYDTSTSRAAVKLTQETGRVRVEGELIRAFLELYYRALVTADYLDSVYSVTIENPVSGAVVLSAGGNGATMDRLNIADDFAAYFPAKMTVTHDADLQTINPLNY